ncbi:hypothetical protein TNCV_44391 [Trichonephila clavipes]|nr:hypothetical protein TNCV_44391 [Trichonephila clavipes]
MVPIHFLSRKSIDSSRDRFRKLGLTKRRNSLLSTEVEEAFRRATMFVCVFATSRYTKSLRSPHRKTSDGVRSDDFGNHKVRRTMIDPVIGVCHIRMLHTVFLSPSHNKESGGAEIGH